MRRVEEERRSVDSPEGPSGRTASFYGRSLIWPHAVLVGIAIALLLAYWVRFQLLTFHEQSFATQEFSRLFDLNGEANIPSWYSCLLWQIAALRAFVLSRTDFGRTGGVPNRFFWIGLAATALLLSLDEAAQIHEMIGAIADRYGMLLPVYSWIPFGTAFAVLLAVAFGRFILGLQHVVALTILASGFIFVLGAIGFESLGALVELGSLGDFPLGITWDQAVGLEEMCEMLGIILFGFALALQRMKTNVRYRDLGLSATPQGDKAAHAPPNAPNASGWEAPE